MQQDRFRGSSTSAKGVISFEAGNASVPASCRGCMCLRAGLIEVTKLKEGICAALPCHGGMITHSEACAGAASHTAKARVQSRRTRMTPGTLVTECVCLIVSDRCCAYHYRCNWVK